MQNKLNVARQRNIFHRQAEKRFGAPDFTLLANRTPVFRLQYVPNAIFSRPMHLNQFFYGQV